MNEIIYLTTKEISNIPFFKGLHLVLAIGIIIGVSILCKLMFKSTKKGKNEPLY